MNIPMVDLKSQYQKIKDEIQEAISKVLESTAFIMGPDVSQLEKEIAQYCGVKHAIGVGSGTEALHVSLMACGITAGDEVIVPTFTFVATAEVVSILGAKPVFADINPRTFNISIEEIKKRITPKTRCIIPVHLYGQPAEMDEIMELAKKHNLLVVEDCAQAMGAEWKGKKAGSIGDTGCLSFFPSKNLGGYGDGGMILTNRDDLAEKAKAIKNHGSKKKYYHHMIGLNSRLDTLQAAILRVKFRYLDRWNELRRNAASLYDRAFSASPYIIPSVVEGAHHVYHQYTIRTPERDKLQAYLKEKGIASMIYYPLSLHLQEAYAASGYKMGDLPDAEACQKDVLSLPICPEMNEEKVAYVTSVMDEFKKTHLTQLK